MTETELIRTHIVGAIISKEEAEEWLAYEGNVKVFTDEEWVAFVRYWWEQHYEAETYNQMVEWYQEWSALKEREE